MFNHKTHISNKINAVDDADNKYLIIEYTTVTNIRPQGYKFPISTPPGAPVYRLDDDRRVFKLSETEFQIADSGIKLHKRP